MKDLRRFWEIDGSAIQFVPMKKVSTPVSTVLPGFDHVFGVGEPPWCAAFRVRT